MQPVKPLVPARFRIAAARAGLLGACLMTALAVGACRDSAPAEERAAAEPPAGASTPVAQAHDHDHAADLAVPRVTPAEVAAKMENDGVVVIDVRSVGDYLAGHIPGALQIPFSYVEGEVPHLPRDKPIVTYCS
jgi:hypothetical protein